MFTERSYFLKRIVNINVTGSAENSKEKPDESSEVDEEQTRPNQADDNEEGNLEAEEGTGQPEPLESQDPEEIADLDLPDDLQLDDEGNEDNDGESSQNTPYFSWHSGVVPQETKRTDLDGPVAVLICVSFFFLKAYPLLHGIS